MDEMNLEGMVHKVNYKLLNFSFYLFKVTYWG